MFVVQMSSQTPFVRSLILTEIASVYHFVVDGRRVWRRLIKISFIYTYIQWRCAPGSHTGPRAHFPELSASCPVPSVRPAAVARSRPPCPPRSRPLAAARKNGAPSAADPDWWELTGYMYPTLYPTFLDVPHVPQVGYKWGTKSSPLSK